MTGVLVAETDEDLRTRVADLLGALGQGVADPEAWLADRRRRWIMGTPDEAMARVRALEATGMQRSCSRTFSRATSTTCDSSGASFATDRPSLAALRLPGVVCATLALSGSGQGPVTSFDRGARTSSAITPMRAPASGGRHYA